MNQNECASWWCVKARKYASWHCCEACRALAVEIETANLNLCVLPTVIHSADCGRQKAQRATIPTNLEVFKKAA